MSVEVRTSDLNTLLRRGKKLVGRLGPHNSFLRVDRWNSLKLEVYDSEVSGSFVCPAAVKKMLDRDKVFSQLSEIDDLGLKGNITTLKIRNDTLIVRSGQSKCSLDVGEARFFEYRGSIQRPKLSVKITRPEIQEILSAMSFDSNIIEHVEQRIVRISTHDGHLVFGTNDKYALGLFKSSIEVNQNFTNLIPLEWLTTAATVLPTNVLIGWTDHWFRVTSPFGEVVFHSQPIDDGLPEQEIHAETIKRFRNKKPTCSFVLNVNRAKQVTRSVIGTNLKSAPKIKISVKNGFVRLSALSNEGRRMAMKVPIEGIGGIGIEASAKMWIEFVMRLRGEAKFSFYENTILMEDAVRAFCFSGGESSKQ